MFINRLKQPSQPQPQPQPGSSTTERPKSNRWGAPAAPAPAATTPGGVTNTGTYRSNANLNLANAATANNNKQNESQPKGVAATANRFGQRANQSPRWESPASPSTPTSTQSSANILGMIPLYFINIFSFHPGVCISRLSRNINYLILYQITYIGFLLIWFCFSFSVWFRPLINLWFGYGQTLLFDLLVFVRLIANLVCVLIWRVGACIRNQRVRKSGAKSASNVTAC